MQEIKTEIINEIKKDLLEKWYAGSTINSQVERESDSIQRSILRGKLQKAENEKFNEVFDRIDLGTKFNQIQSTIAKSLDARHPWLNDEPNQNLKSILLREIVGKLLFDLLEGKPNFANSWKSIDIRSELRWKSLETDNQTQKVLYNMIEGYPLSNHKYYENCEFPSFLESPLDLSPTRYDVYRLLLNNYPQKFESKKLANGIFYTKIEPLHFSELSKLDATEWTNIDTMLVNFGEESRPVWVLLQKQGGMWNLYVPDFLREDCLEKCQTIPQLREMNVTVVNHEGCNNAYNWNHVLLSRILPWTQLPASSSKPNLDSFREKIPLSVLVQDTIEASCLKGQKKYATSCTNAFSLSYPLSDKTLEELYKGPEPTKRLFDNTPLTPAKSIIEAFDTNKISYDLTQNRITVLDNSKLIEAMQLAYHLSVTSLSLSSHPDRSSHQWFTYNLNIVEVISDNNPEHFGYIHACAARNRFIKVLSPDYLQTHDHFEARKNAWKYTGKLIYDFLHDNQNLPGQLRDIAEMGKHGLDTLFTYLNTLENAPNLSCSLDLNSGQSSAIKTYIEELTAHIHSFTQGKLFDALNLILPDIFNEASQSSFFDLLKEIGSRQELENIQFTNTNGLTKAFLGKLNEYVAFNNICLQIVIPEWDKQTFANEKDKGELKALYRVLQNTIQDNIRKTRQNNLSANTKTIQEPEDVLKLKRRNNVVVELPNWRPNIQYRLASSSVGVQQQAQQEVAQEAQQKQDKQSAPKTPVKRAIQIYDKAGELISRQNLNGIDEITFSNWVGSNKDAHFIIQKIDAAALAQIQKYLDLFKYGIDPERTPGFRLFYTSADDKSLILSFNPELVEQDLLDLKDDPFAIRMNDIKPKTEFYGDFRQFSAFGRLDGTKQVTCWHHLALESNNLPESIRKWLQENQETSSESLQCLNATNSITKSQDQAEMIAIIKAWSKQKDPAFLSNLVEKFNEQNLQAFGQLFYHYGIEGNEQWIELTYKVHEKFKDYFKIFKERLLDPLKDWSESLEQSEVKALTQSITKLEEQPEYTEILWKLVDTHGANVGRMRFSEVWSAYVKVIDFINNNDLEINKDKFLAAIAKYQDNFNATQFLRRIYEVLQATSNRQDSIEIQTEILNNLSEIDWHENGFYYACTNEYYRYWDADLKLENFADNLDSSYVSKFDDINLNEIRNLKTYTLRYAAQHLKLNKKDFNKFKELTKDIQNPRLMRLILASIALGMDSINELENFDWNKFNNLSDENFDIVNQLLRLDQKDLQSRSYHVCLQDLPILLKVLSGNPIQNVDLNVINSLGRALQSYQSTEKEQKLGKLISYGQTHGFDSPLFTSFPWLVEEPIENQPTTQVHQKFYEQLQSINFKESKLPDKNTLNQLLTNMRTTEDRRSAVSSLIESGCKITNQDAEYRPLNVQEKRLVENIFLAKTFKTRNLKLLNDLFEHLAIRQGEEEKITNLLKFFEKLDKKNYYDELGQLLGLLIEKAQGDKFYSTEQLTMWLNSIFDEESFKSNPYPVTFIKELLNETLSDNQSSLLSANLHHLKGESPTPLLSVKLSQINLLSLNFVAKNTLVKTAIKLKSDGNFESNVNKVSTIFTQIKKSDAVTSACGAYISQLLSKRPGDLAAKLGMLEKLTTCCQVANNILNKLWENNQLKLFEALDKKALTDEIVDSLVRIEDEYARMILIEACTDKDDAYRINAVKTSILRLNAQEKEKLALYYATEPKPNLSQLSELLGKGGSVEKMINHFEMVMLPFGKRYYSLEPKDAVDIKRVLSGIKINKQSHGIADFEQAELLRLLYHCNEYSQLIKLNTKSYDELLAIIIENKTQPETPEAKARILACIREVIVRKTGKWIKHTQMLDLIYSALHNDDSLLHQIRMGEGKSIIGLARDAYLALHGEIVDVYSSKESLSARDHLESMVVLDAFGIRHAHITASSEPDEYQSNIDRRGIGAVHYATIGNWSLFYSGVRWQNKDKNNRINVYLKNRRARCDEGDYVMRSENTLFNFSDFGDSKDIYNYDAWAYQIAYEYYLANQDKFAQNELQVTEDADLQALYELLEKAAKTIAPDKSTLFQNHLASGDINIRNNQLVKLLTAAHLAQKLKNGVDFCVMSEQKRISETTSIDIRFAKVMINNQVYHGSTYSDLVQQFLHVRLNNEAIRKHETPNFFIEPESEIALSSNAKFILQNYYATIEALTGTAGDKEAVIFYRDNFGVRRVIKLPTHEEIKTTFLAPEYVGTEIKDRTTDAIEKLNNPSVLSQEDKTLYEDIVKAYIKEGLDLQLAKILESLQSNPDQPTLITCEDDEQVEILGKLIQEALGNRVPALVIDTNARGISEAEILKDAGIKGAITISSRLGRGSDINPYDKRAGLKVLRTYPATPDVVKQEEGRQGRNGAGGTCQDIINYNSVLVDLHRYQNHSDFDNRFKLETEHLEAKLQKHDGLAAKGNSSKPKWQAVKANENDIKQKYLTARTIQYIKQKIKFEAKERMARKDNLLIEGSALVMDRLFRLTLEEQDALKRSWKKCRREIEIHWTDEQECASQILRDFYDANNIEDTRPKKINQAQLEEADNVFTEEDKIPKLIAFHQAWLRNIFDYNFSDELISGIYGDKCEKLDSLYNAFHRLNNEQIEGMRDLLNENSRLCHSITCDAWLHAIDVLIEDQVNFHNNLNKIKAYFSKTAHTPNNINEVNVFSQNFVKTVEGVPDIDFILDVSTDYGLGNLEDIIRNFSREVVYLCKNCMNEEDIVFFLTTLNKTTKTDKILAYLKDNFNALKENYRMIVPVISVLAQNNPDVPFDKLEYNETMPGILRLLGQRPGFDARDFERLQDKVTRIPEAMYRQEFLAMLSTIPPFVSIKSILKDLVDLPSLDFNGSCHMLKSRVQEIQESARIFNTFLFKLDIISNEYDPRGAIVDESEYAAWQAIYLKLNISQRKMLFTETQNLINIPRDKLHTLANNYTQNPSNQKLFREISVLQSTLKQNTTSTQQKENVTPTSTQTRFFSNW